MSDDPERDWSAFSHSMFEGRIWNIVVSHDVVRHASGSVNMMIAELDAWVDGHTSQLSAIALKKIARGEHGPDFVTIELADWPS